MTTATDCVHGVHSTVDGVGTGHAHGAVSVLNATATGRGCSLAIEEGLTATWAWGGPDFRFLTRDRDDRVARAVHHILRDPHGGGAAGACVATRTSLPPSRGLKTSSAAAGALVRAALAGVPCDIAEVEALAVTACRAAGVTLTGALDDQVAAMRGGCHLTDNAAGILLQRLSVPRWHVAVWVPEPCIAKKDVARIPTAPIVSECHAAEALLRAGDVPGAMTRSGAAFLRLYAAAGLPVTDAPVRAALATGALGAGLSGTGPAVAALFSDRTDLPDVPGGAWMWTRVATGAP